MKLYDFLATHDYCCDAYDDVYDTSVTADINPKPEDDYDEFCTGLVKLVEVKGTAWDGNPICGWSDLIERNIKVFRKFANDNWIKNNYEDEDDFICEWIEELHRFMAGYGEYDQYWFYKSEIVDKCK